MYVNIGHIPNWQAVAQNSDWACFSLGKTLEKHRFEKHTHFFRKFATKGGILRKTLLAFQGSGNRQYS